MSDRVYLRANFSSSTAPSSGGAGLKNAAGDIYARIPLQLPSNLVDNTKAPTSVDMMLTKLSIPLGRVPICQIPVESVVDTTSASPLPITTPPSSYVRTKLLFAIWPYCLDGYGNVIPSSCPREWYDPENYTYFPDPFPVWNMDVQIKELRGTSAYSEKLKQIREEGVITMRTPEELTHMLSQNLTELFRVILSQNPPSESARLNSEYWDIAFHIKNSRLEMEVYQEGAEIDTDLEMFYPITNRLFRRLFNGWAIDPGYPVMSYSVNGEGAVEKQNRGAFSPFSIIGNQYLVDLLPGLPWIKIDNRSLPAFNTHTGAGQSVLHWTEKNYGDPYFYVLDTSNVNISLGPEVRTLPTNSTDPDGGATISRSLIYSFDNLNLISLVPITSFVVVLNGLTMTPQTYPVNINPQNASAAQTTTIPIIEVYYPLWSSIDDLSTNLVVSKDAFTNAAPFVLGPDALQQRNLTFEVYYVTNDGGLHLLTIPPGTCLNLQICYSIAYY